MDKGTVRTAVFERLVTHRPGTWHIRRHLAPVFGQVVSVCYDDGQRRGVEGEGVLLDVLHSRRLGYALRLQGLLPKGRRRDVRYAHRRRRVCVVPLSQVQQPYDPSIAFLFEPGTPMDPRVGTCHACGERDEAGRFCVSCGAKLRPNPGSVFAIEQQVLREGGAREHGCGAVVAAWMNRCPKCGRSCTDGSGPGMVTRERESGSP